MRTKTIFNSKNFEFSKSVSTIQFQRLWRMFLDGKQKFSEISKKITEERSIFGLIFFFVKMIPREFDQVIGYY